MDPRWRARMVLHGSLVVMIGLLAGLPYAMVLTGGLAGEERAWRMAHLEGVLNGLLVLAMAAGGDVLVLSARSQAVLAVSLNRPVVASSPRDGIACVVSAPR